MIWIFQKYHTAFSNKGTPQEIHVKDFLLNIFSVSSVLMIFGFRKSCLSLVSSLFQIVRNMTIGSQLSESPGESWVRSSSSSSNPSSLSSLLVTMLDMCHLSPSITCWLISCPHHVQCANKATKYWWTETRISVYYASWANTDSDHLIGLKKQIRTPTMCHCVMQLSLSPLSLLSLTPYTIHIQRSRIITQLKRERRWEISHRKNINGCWMMAKRPISREGGLAFKHPVQNEGDCFLFSWLISPKP